MDKENDELPMDGPSPVVDGPTLIEEPQAEEPKEEPKQPRDESGKFAAKGEEEDAPPASGQDNVPIKALQDERRKRQELEQQLAAMQRPADPPVSIWDNDEKWQQQFGEKVTQSAVQHAALNARLDTSEMLASQAHEDFEQVKAEWLEMVQQNPELRQQALADRHPWERAYQQAKNARTMKELGATSIDDLKAKLRAELEAEMANKSPARTFPNSTVHDGSAASRAGPGWAGPTADKDILPMG